MPRKLHDLLIRSVVEDLTTPPAIFRAGPTLWSLGEDPLNSSSSVVHVSTYSASRDITCSFLSEGRALAAADAAAGDLLALSGIKGIAIFRGGDRLVLIAAFDSFESSSRATRSKTWRVFDLLAGWKFATHPEWRPPEVADGGHERASFESAAASGDEAAMLRCSVGHSGSPCRSVSGRVPQPGASPALSSCSHSRRSFCNSGAQCFAVSSLYNGVTCWSLAGGVARACGTQHLSPYRLRLDSAARVLPPPIARPLRRFISCASAGAFALHRVCGLPVYHIAAEVVTSVMFGAVMHVCFLRISARLH